MKTRETTDQQMNTDKHKLKKAAPAWHAQVAAEINREFAETNELNEKARHRRARLGLMLVWVKEAGKADGSIPHGYFGEWLETNAPGIPRRTVGDYLTEAKSICELLRWQNGEIRHFETPPHRLLVAESGELKGVEKERQKKLLGLIEQQSNYRAVTQYKQVELKDDETVAKRGRLKGSAGNTKSMRLAHKIKMRELSLAEKKAAMLNCGAACDQVFDEVIADPELRAAFEELFPKVENLFHFMQRVQAARVKN